jgi:uncharacterized damage-inducible protein DinB
LPNVAGTETSQGKKESATMPRGITFMKNCLLLAAFLPATYLCAQSSDAMSKGNKMIYTSVKNNILKAAQAVPESDYGYKPAATVRSFGELVAHVADGQYEFCSGALGDTSEHASVEKGKKSKTEIVDALKMAFAYCDKAYDGMTDAHAADEVSFFGQKMTKINILTFNTAHTDEHYGNIVTYMRMKGLVPPSSKQ